MKKLLLTLLFIPLLAGCSTEFIFEDPVIKTEQVKIASFAEGCAQGFKYVLIGDQPDIYSYDSTWVIKLDKFGNPVRCKGKE